MSEDRTEIVLRSGRFDHVKIRMARGLIDGTQDLDLHTPITRRFYAGCKDEAGHYLWDDKGGKPKHQYGPGSPIPWESWDGKLQPRNGSWGDALIFYKREKDGPMWTAIGFWDSTIDKRPGSCSCFFADSHLSFDEMLADAKEHWPSIFQRFPFEVVEVEP